MKVCSNSNFTLSAMFFEHRVRVAVVAGDPPRSSSQLADHSIFMSLPEISDLGRATGVCSCAGASVRVVVVVGPRLVVLVDARAAWGWRRW
ncbi:MAG: hypothetical protein WKF47_16415 [Geodermatophilaceae bacterium]